MDVIIVTALFGVLGIMVGYKVGAVLGDGASDNRSYWLRNLAVVLVGVAVSAMVAATGLTTLAGLTIGAIGGAIAGCKMGYGKSVGAWRRHDEHFRVNKDQVAAARSSEQARADNMTDEERASRELVSVSGAPGAAGSASAGDDAR